MAFRIITGLCVLILLYGGFEWVRIAWLMRDAKTPDAAFLVQDTNTGPALNVFVDYRCGNCQPFYKAVDDLRTLHPDLHYIIRPLIWIDDRSDTLTRFVLAAGLEGKFLEMHEALLERNGDIPDSFLRETASLYGLDYDALVEKAQSDEVTKMADDNGEDAAGLGIEVIPSLSIGPVYFRPAGPLEALSVSDLLPALEQARQTR